MSRKCFGIAKNFFTNAMKQNANNPEFMASIPKYPWIFSKPLSCVQRARDNNVFQVDANLGPQDVNFEIELGVLFGKDIKDEKITEKNFTDYIAGYFLLMDYTDKVNLGKDINEGGPFLIAKCQDNFLVLSEFIEKDKIGDPHAVDLELKVDGEVRQKDITGNMLFKIHEQMEYIRSQNVTVNEGDLLLSGTPEGIAFVEPGNHISA